MPSTLITGANRGLGLEFARQYAAEGWKVYAACRDPRSASELRRLADTSDHKIRVIGLDVTDLASVKSAAARLDGQAIDLLLNNAGVGGARGQTVGNVDYSNRCCSRHKSSLLIACTYRIGIAPMCPELLMVHCLHAERPDDPLPENAVEERSRSALHHMRNVITALTASARRSPQTGFGKSGAPGTSLRMRLTVSGSVYPVTKTIRASHASRSFLATSIPSWLPSRLTSIRTTSG